MHSKLSLGLLLGGTVMLFSTAAVAQDTMAGFYNNTVIVTVQGMGDFRTVYADDHTYASNGPFGPGKGTWALADGKVCRTQSDPTPPPQMPNPICDSIEAHKVGDSWQVEAMGQKFDAKLVEGNKLSEDNKP